MQRLARTWRERDREYSIDARTWHHNCRYMKDEIFRGLVTERLEAKSMAVSKLRLWLEDRILTLVEVVALPRRAAHRLLLLRLRAGLRAVSSLEERRRQALELCRVRGLVQAEVDEVNELKETRFIVAAADGESTETLQLLCDAGADVHAVNGRGYNALMMAALNGHAEAVQTLVKLGVGHTAKPGDGGASALMLAAYNGHTELVATLAGLGGDLQAAYGKGFTPLIWAASRGHAGTVTELVRLGAAVEAETKGGLTAALIAAQNGHAGVVAALHGAGADLGRKGPDGSCVTATAAKNGHADVLRELGRLGAADVGGRDEMGRTALMKAARGGHFSAVKVMLGMGADAAAADAAGETALFAAVTARAWKVAAALLAAGGAALLAARNLDGRTCLSYAVEDGEEGAARALVADAGLDVGGVISAAAGEVAAERAAAGKGLGFVRFKGAAGEAYVGWRTRTVGFREFCSVRATAVCRAGRAAYMEVELLSPCEAPQVP